jgi:hypothetical protein
MSSRASRAAAVALGLFALAAAPPGAAQPDPAPRLPVVLLMKYVTNPAAEAFWAASGVVETEAGATDRAPTDDARWTATANAAAMVMESSVLMLSAPGAPDEADWRGYAEALARAGAAGLAAAQAKDADGLLLTGGDMFDACRGCHVKYARRRE